MFNSICWIAPFTFAQQIMNKRLAPKPDQKSSKELYEEYLKLCAERKAVKALWERRVHEAWNAYLDAKKEL